MVIHFVDSAFFIRWMVASLTLANPLDCHADSANLLAMTEKQTIEVMAVEVLYL